MWLSSYHSGVPNRPVTEFAVYVHTTTVTTSLAFVCWFITTSKLGGNVGNGYSYSCIVKRARITICAKGSLLLGVMRRNTIFFYLGWPEGIVSIPVGQPDPTRPISLTLTQTPYVPIHGWRLVVVPCGLVLCASLVRFCLWFCVRTQSKK